MRSRLFKHGDRAAYKTSEVIALFLLGILLSGITFLTIVVIDYVIRLVFGPK